MPEITNKALEMKEECQKLFESTRRVDEMSGNAQCLLNGGLVEILKHPSARSYPLKV